MKLLEYCEFRKKTLKQFCDEKGYRYGYMRQVSSGDVRPSPDLALRIEQDTEGLVTRMELLYKYPKKKNQESCRS